MARGSAQQNRFISARVRALAIVRLTRRPDLILKEEPADAAIDLIVTLANEERPGVRQFGVELSGIWSKCTAASANASLRPKMQSLLRYAPFPFPVVVFFFTMEDDRSWYTWAAEPVVREDGFELIQHSSADCRPLDDAAVDEIVESVDRWYDAFFANATREADSKRR
jgi:hypothetical protein